VLNYEARKSSMANQTLNPFATPKETKKLVEPIGGKFGFFDETERNFEDLETSRFISQENFTIEPAAVIEAAENIIKESAANTSEESAAIAAAESIIKEAAIKPQEEKITVFSEGSLVFNKDTSIEINLSKTEELRVNPDGPRDIQISASDQKEAFATLFSAGTDVAKDAVNKAVSTTLGGAKDALEEGKNLVKVIIGQGAKQEQKSPEKIAEEQKAAEQRAYLASRQQEAPHFSKDEIGVFKVKTKTASRDEIEKVLGRITGDSINEKGELKSYAQSEVEKAFDEADRLRQLDADRKAQLATATGKGKGLDKGELDKGTENPNHFTHSVN